MTGTAARAQAEIAITVSLPDAAATRALGRELALFARPGLRILLHGDLGAGKSTLARAFIRALAPQMGEFEVPSPTFTLVQTYDFTRLPVAHADLYRLSDPFEADELGLDELARDHVLLVEWPDRLPEIPPARLDIHLEYDGEGRAATLRGFGESARALERMALIRDFLARHYGDAPVERAFLQGDASARRYEYVSAPGRPRAILMDMPARPDGPPVYGGKSYDQIAALSRDIRAVEAVNSVLREKGYSAPRTYARDFSAGLMLVEDLGEAVFGGLYAQGEMEEPLKLAVDMLTDMAGREWPREVTLPGGERHVIRDYDDAAFQIEVQLLIEWLWPRLKGGPAPVDAVEEYAAIWSGLFPLARAGRPVWVLRDYHSPNLLLVEGRSGLARLGLIDTQDAVMGPAAYDLASLLQDARIEIPAALRKALLARYCAARAAAGADFDEQALRRAFVIMGAQRACKVLGIFARLNDRDGKPAYLAHMPRVAGYLAENLAHPDLKPLAEWFARHLPEALDRERLRREAP